MKVFYKIDGTEYMKTVRDMDEFNRICIAEALEPKAIEIDGDSFFKGMHDMMLSDMTNLESYTEVRDNMAITLYNGEMRFDLDDYVPLRNTRIRLETVADLIKAKQTIQYLGKNNVTNN